MHRQTFKTTLSEGGGEGKHFCDYDCVSIPGREEISTRFWFVSTSFVRGCSTNSPWAYIREGLLLEEYLRLRFGGLIVRRAYF